MSIYIGGSTISDIYVGGSTSRLPSTYQEVEYIQSSGTQWINTGVYVNGDYTTEIKYQATSFGNFNTMFGTRSSNGNARYLARNDIYDYFWVNRSTNTNNSYEKYTNSTPRDYNVHTIKMNRYLYVDGTLVYTFSAIASSTLFPYSVYLFALNSEGSGVDNFNGKIYYCKIWNDSNVLVRNFVPCYRKSDNVIGMYDLVNNTFYTNAGSGTFTKGTNVGGRGNVSAVYVGTTKVRPKQDLVLQKVFDFTTNDWKGYTMTPTNGAGLVIDTSGHYCRGPRNDAYSTHGNGSVWKTINATRYWGRIKVMYNENRSSGCCIGPFDLWSGAENIYNANLSPGDQKFELGCTNNLFPSVSESVSTSPNTYYYIDFKFDNGACTGILSNSSLTPIKTITAQSSSNICKYAGFSMWGYSGTNSNFKVYEYREAYDNN